MTDICQFNLDELKEYFKEKGIPAYRAAQVYGWLHKKKAVSFEEMGNIPKDLKKMLGSECRITVMDAADVLVSGIDGTRKYVFALYDGNVIESVFMKYHHGNSVCVSSQVGCRMGCTFCASTLDGCVRNLTAAEMLAEVYRIENDTGERVSNVVIMGSGEPMDNLDEVIRFIRMLSDENGLNISARNITVSTCGLVPGIRKLADSGLPVTLALSLHAPTQELREKLMPVSKAYKLPEVLDACGYYFQKTGRRLTFEYSVVKGVNDSVQQAMELSRLIGPLHGHVNLIPVNPVKERSYESPEKETVNRFMGILNKNGVNATVRREMGRDISSACGQLRRRHIQNAGLRTD